MIRRIIGRHAKLRFSRALWRGMIAELARRGRGSRESGAFLLTAIGSDGRTITQVAYFDDLDPDCLTGGITMSGAAFPRLWDLCERHGLRVAGDVHTHPGGWVEQSTTDQDNPMIAKVGHIALIVPGYAQRGARTDQVGVHEYRGDAGWRAHLGNAAATTLYVGWWA